MNKRIIIGVLTVIVIAIIGTCGYFFLNNNQKMDEKSSENNSKFDGASENNDSQDNENDNKVTSNRKTLVVYYSASGSTKKVAENIAQNLDADLFEIVPVDIYTSDDLNWTDSNSRVTREHNDESLRDIKLKNTKVSNWDNYDTILIGYPIWWGVAAWPVNNFVKDNDFTGKTVIPFCTSASSSIGNSGKLLEDLTKTGNWKSGHRFSSSASDNDIKGWTDNLVK